MDVRMFIGACLLLATMANVSNANDGQIGLNFCRETVKTFSENWKNGHGGNELVKKITKEHGSYKNWASITPEAWTEYSKSVSEKSRKRIIQMCIDFGVVQFNLGYCIGSLASAGQMIPFGESVWKSWDICARFYQDEIKLAMKGDFKVGKPLIDSCETTVDLFRAQWYRSYEQNQLIDAIKAENPSSSDLILCDDEWKVYRKKFSGNQSYKTMCQDFIQMRVVGFECKKLLYRFAKDHSKLLVEFHQDEEDENGEEDLALKINNACVNIYPELLGPPPGPNAA